MKEKIKQLARQFKQEIIDIRHHLHANPELSYKEFETSKFIQEQLSQLKIPYEVKASTGVVGILRGKNPNKKVVALRADMDALPITEENNIDYRSRNAGCMHACGHDVHMACLLGAVKILSALKDEWEGTIKIIFQPGEEKNPGGASLMIKENVLENPAPSSIFALHVNPQLEVGKLSFRSGQVMASADEIYITVRSNGGHAAAAHLTVDTILVASHLVVALQTIISRNCPPLTSSVLSITAFNGGYTTNVIPTEVKLMGTFRAMDEQWRFKAHRLIKEQCTLLAKSFGADIDILIDVGYPMVNNNDELTKKAKQKATEYLTEQDVEETDVRMGAEDFGFYTQKIPGCFFRLGVKNEAKQIVSGVHTPTFNIDEDALEVGMGIMAWLGCSVE